MTQDPTLRVVEAAQAVRHYPIVVNTDRDSLVKFVTIPHRLWLEISEAYDAWIEAKR